MGFLSRQISDTTIVWAEVTNVDAAKVNILMSNRLTQMVLSAAASGMTLAGKTISSFVISGSLITLTVSVAYAAGDAVTLSYTAPMVDALCDENGRGIANFSGYAVTNNIGSDVAVTFTERTATFEDVSAGLYRAASGAGSLTAYALSDRKIPAGGSGGVQMDYTSAANQSSALGLRSTRTNDPYALIDFNGITSTGTPNQLLRSVCSATFTGAGYTLVIGTDTKWRLYRNAAAKTITIDTFASGTWTTRYTFPAANYYDGDLWVVSGVNVALKQLLNPVAIGSLPA